MKSGAGDDPFSDLPPEADAEAEAEEQSAAVDDAAGSESVDDDTASSAGTETAGDASLAESTQSDDAIPWILRRRSVKDNRPNVTQFFLRDETDRAERRFRGEVEEQLDTDVYLLDLREAAYVVAMQHPDEVASLLGRWGYDYRD